MHIYKHKFMYVYSCTIYVYSLSNREFSDMLFLKERFVLICGCIISIFSILQDCFVLVYTLLHFDSLGKSFQTVNTKRVSGASLNPIDTQIETSSSSYRFYSLVEELSNLFK